MFRFSEKATYTLKLISNKFQQAATDFEGLFHQRFLPWDGFHESRIDDEQWLQFIEANRPFFDEDEWWECYLASCAIGLSGNFLNRWFGNPDGIDYFNRLVDSTLLVLHDADFSAVNDSEIPFRFRDLDDWLSTIHNWASRFEMPFLRSRMEIWNSATQGQQAFDNLTKIWTEKDGISIPAHPLCWTLCDDLFTCSAMAIEAMLNPLLFEAPHQEPLVIGAVEPESPLIVVENDAHRLIETALGYIVVIAGSGRLLASKENRIGLSRLAVLLSYPNEDIEAMFLSTVDVKTHRSEWRNAPQLRRREKAPLIKSDNAESYIAIRKEMERLTGEIIRAKNAGNYALQAELREELEEYEKEYEFGEDGLVYRKNRDRDLKVKNKADAIQKGIKKALEDMKSQAPEFAGILDDLDKSIERERGFFRYSPSAVGKPWVVTELT